MNDIRHGGVIQSNHSLLPVLIIDREKHPAPWGGGAYLYYVKVRYADGADEWLHREQVVELEVLPNG